MLLGKVEEKCLEPWNFSRLNTYYHFLADFCVNADHFLNLKYNPVIWIAQLC